MSTAYEFLHVEGGSPVKMWTRGVPVDDKAKDQLSRAARMPFIFKHVAAMPDVHVGIGATVGSVIPTKGAVIPAAVGVDIGCGMMAARTSLMAHDLPDNLEGIRSAIEQRGAARPRRRPRQARQRRVGRAAARDRRGLGDARRAFQADHRQISEAQEDEQPRPSRHARHRQSFHRALPRRRGAGLGDAPFGEARRRQCDRQLLHRAGEAGHAQMVHQPARRESRLLPGRDRAFRRLCRGGRLGAGFRGAEPADDDDQRHRGPAGRNRQAVQGRAGGGQLPSQLCDRGRTISARTCSSPGKARCARRRA